MRAAGYHRCCELGGGCRGGGWGLWEAHDAFQYRGHHPRRDDQGRDARRLEQDDRGQPDCAFPGFEDRCEIGREACRERVCEYVKITVVAVTIKNKKKTKAQ